MKKIITLAIILVSAFSTSAMAAEITFYVAPEYLVKNIECVGCLPEYLVVWGKSEQEVKNFLKDHFHNEATFLGDNYIIPSKCQTKIKGQMKVKKDETFFLKSTKKGVCDKYYHFISNYHIVKNMMNGEINISLPKKMDDGNYWAGVIAIDFTCKSDPDIIKFTVKDGKLQ